MFIVYYFISIIYLFFKSLKHTYIKNIIFVEILHENVEHYYGTRWRGREMLEDPKLLFLAVYDNKVIK